MKNSIMEVKVYRLNNPDDLENINKRLKFIGLSIQPGMFGDYAAYLDENRYSTVTVRKAGRHTVITPQIVYSVLQYRSEGMTIKDISSKLRVSKGTVYNVIKKHTPKKKTCPGQIQMEL